VSLERYRAWLIALLGKEQHSVRECEEMARHLFCLIDEQHGVAEARRIFANWSNPPTANDLKRTASIVLLSELYEAGPERNIEAFARTKAAKNRRLRPADRPKGAAGNTDSAQLARHIRKLIAIVQWPVRRNPDPVKSD